MMCSLGASLPKAEEKSVFFDKKTTWTIDVLVCVLYS